MLPKAILPFFLLLLGCFAEMNETQGIVSSPGFGHANYPNMLLCTWIIRTENLPMSYIFHNFDTERKYDVLTLRKNTGVAIETYSGSKTKGWVTNQWILETQESYVKITFISDVTNSMGGFNTTYSIGKLFFLWVTITEYVIIIFMLHTHEIKVNAG